MDDLVAIARVAKPRGIKGEVIADLLTDFPERFEGLENVTAVLQTGERQELTIENHWFQAGRVVLKFLGYDSMNDADDLRKAEICVGESEAVELESDEFFEWELEGCLVEDVTGNAIGIVETLMRTGGPELLVVRDGIKEHLIPFVEAICVAVDIQNKRIIIDPPEGLLEF
ncbi:MAG: 16S rRNA processing protein RimM [Acidobacteria bacterium]|nr:16S rRNA processing protein RimM [Acidobacteriota bacterium]